MFASAHVDTFTRQHLPPQEQWPHLLFTRPEFQYPERLNAAVALLDQQVATGRGNAPCLHTIAQGRILTCTYAQLQHRVNQIAQVLTQDMGLVPGNRVLLRGPNNPMMAACWLAIIKAGLVAVGTMPLLRSKELKQIIDKAQVQAALCDIALYRELADCADQQHPHYCLTLKQIKHFNSNAVDDVDALANQKSGQFIACATAQDDVALIAFTSGTTGQPKGCMHFHRDVLAMCDAFARHVLKPDAADVFCGTPPLAFTFGLGGLLAFPLWAGASTVLMEKLTPESLLATIAQTRTTICFTAPTFYRQMAALAGAHDVRSLSKCVSAGEALPDATRTLWRNATGIEMTDGIGATEMMHIFIGSQGAHVRSGAIGQAVPGYEAMIVDDAMNPLPPNTVGKLAVRGPTGCRYLADARQANYVKQGWNLPGDTFLMRSDGYFVYQARSDDMIISAGYNIAGPEVESALLAHAAVAECGVIGVADEERGQIVKAFVVLKPGFEADAAMIKTLQDFVKQAIAPYKYPRMIEFCASLPRTETGKLQRFKLRESAA
jgi:2-aminobenzoate-CoA ligase